ncbi:MAG: dipicolinate synthase subunit B [Clostridia bacterium]|nr:dipicolinate synthase subunit B [Clostridia bacterium]
MKGLKVGFAMCGSFCTFSQVIPIMERLCLEGAQVIPIMSQMAYSTDTRFGKASEHISRIEQMTGRAIIHTVAAAEPIGPKKMLDVLVIAPCTGNTLAKLAAGMTDTPVARAAKAHLRNERPVILSVASNDGLGASAKNIGTLLNTKRVYFTPFGQDDSEKKPNSLIAHFDMIPDAISAAVRGEQIQPVLMPW